MHEPDAQPTIDGLSRRAALAIGGAGATALAIGLAGRADAGSDAVTAQQALEQLGGSVGFVAGQTARLVFVHHVHAGDIVPCVVVARIRGLDGAVLAERRFENPPPNAGDFIDLAYPAAGPPQRPKAGARLQVFAELEHTPGHRLGGSLEIYDARTGTSIATIIPCIVPDPGLTPR